MVTPTHLSPSDPVGTDAESFNDGELLEGKLRAGVTLAGREHEVGPEATVDVDTEHLQRRRTSYKRPTPWISLIIHLDVLAAVALAPLAGDAVHAVHVRLDAAPAADLHVRHPLTHLDNLDTELMADHPRVREQGLVAFECVVAELAR